MLKRHIETELLAWKVGIHRKPLLVRGARQVGKTYSIREFGRTFPRLLEVNFEEHPEVRTFFKGALTPALLCERLSAYFNVPIVEGDTLLFFDEIQACPEAISSLRFFYEQKPGLHVVAAGSLLEFALHKIPSMGVGRITSLFMHPLTFIEFLGALGEGGMLSMMSSADAEHPLDPAFHTRLVDIMRTYMLVGGMPDPVAAYAATSDIRAAMKVMDDLILTLEDDFGKYRERTSVQRLQETFRSVAAQAGEKFTCSKVNREVKSTVVKDTLSLLVHAGLVHLVTHTDARGLPLGAQQDERCFKAYLLDVGIHQRVLGLDIPAHLISGETQLVNKGNLAELFVATQWLAHHGCTLRPSLHYWRREARGANAEVDFVVEREGRIMPVEVKSGTRGSMQSLLLFMKERELRHGIRVSLENFGRVGDIEILPLYAIHRL